MSRGARIASVLLAALLIPIVPFIVIGELPGDRWLLAREGDAHSFGVTGALLLASDVLLPVPSSVIGSLLGARLGFVAGLGYSLLGLCLGNLVGYGLGRLVPARFAAEVPRAPSLWIVFLSRPVPVLAEAVALAAGVERTALGPFLVAAAVGNLCYSAALAADGAALMVDGLTGSGLVFPMALPVLAWLVWRWFASRAR